MSLSSVQEASSETLLRRERWIAEAGLLLLAALGWIYIIGLNAGVWPSLMAMPMRHGWIAGDILLTYLMWLVMMIAMMTPAVIPTILLIATVERRRGRSRPNRQAGLALLGYLSVWSGACILATLVQYGLHEAGFIYGAMSAVGAQLAGVTLILVGLFELTPAKAACLRLCRSPVETIARYWRLCPAAAFGSA